MIVIMGMINMKSQKMYFFISKDYRYQYYKKYYKNIIKNMDLIDKIDKLISEINTEFNNLDFISNQSYLYGENNDLLYKKNKIKNFFRRFFCIYLKCSNVNEYDFQLNEINKLMIKLNKVYLEFRKKQFGNIDGYKFATVDNYYYNQITLLHRKYQYYCNKKIDNYTVWRV